MPALQEALEGADIMGEALIFWRSELPLPTEEYLGVCVLRKAWIMEGYVLKGKLKPIKKVMKKTEERTTDVEIEG